MHFLSGAYRTRGQGRRIVVMRGVKKQDLPAKVCVVCGRPFVWRKKWERVWAEVRYCSDRCRRARVDVR